MTESSSVHRTIRLDYHLAQEILRISKNTDRTFSYVVNDALIKIFLPKDNQEATKEEKG